MRVLDLFSGIGGFSLGLERAGMRTVAFCEIDPYCRAVLKKHWPTIPCYPDITRLSVAHLRADGIAVDVICGGFPCQDISIAGKGAGIDGERSRLWGEFYRLIGEIQPSVVIVENVAEMLNRGMGQVLGDLASLGFDAEWHCIPAAYIGARHIRDRVWIIAHSVRNGFKGPIQVGNRVAPLLSYDWREIARTAFAADPESWASEPAFLGKNDDVPAWMESVDALGNAVVPQIPEIIGRAILEAEKKMKRQ